MAQLIKEYQLVRKGRVLFRSTRKLDAVFKHVQFNRDQGVVFREVNKKG